MVRSLVPENLWRRLRPLLPKRLPNRHVQHAGRKPTPYRKILAGIFFVLKNRVPWRGPPPPPGFSFRHNLPPLAFLKEQPRGLGRNPPGGLAEVLPAGE